MNIYERMDRIERLLCTLIERAHVRECYGIEEFAQIVGRSEFTCRQWCRNGRILASKKSSGRGPYFAWVITHEELQRYRREGLLPFQLRRHSRNSTCGKYERQNEASEGSR